MKRIRGSWVALVTASVVACGQPVAPQTTPEPTTSTNVEPNNGGDKQGSQAVARTTLASTAASDDSGAEGSSEPTLSIYVVDIGQGDSTVVLGPTVNGQRKVLVMDAGHYRGNRGKIVADLLGDLGVSAVDHVVLSHYDADHLGGFTDRGGNDGLLWTADGSGQTMTGTTRSWFPTDTIVDSGDRSNPNVGTSQWLTCAGQLTASGSVNYWRVEGGAHIGDELSLGGGVTARVVAGGGYVWGTADKIKYANTENEMSIALLVSDGNGFEFLVTGDLIGQRSGNENAELEVALGEKLASEGIDVEVLRTGHHGAANATEASFVDNASPEVAVVSCGDDQASNYRHPRCATYQTLVGAGVPVILQTETGKTDCPNRIPGNVTVVDGTIHIEVDNAGYSIRSHGTEGANGNATRAVGYRCTFSGCARLTTSGAQCCRVCRTSQPCGDSCIPKNRNCTKAPGCACAP